MTYYNREDIIRLVEEEDVEFIRLQFTDISGMMKNLAVTSSQLERVLNNEIVFDASSIEGFARGEESEMYLIPDLNTFTIFPWRPQQGKVARFICDVCYADGTPFEGDSRQILKKQIKRAKEMGYYFYVRPECEFFLFHQDDEGYPTTLTHEKAAYFDIGPIDLGENARRDMVLTLEEMGFEIESSHHEKAPGQHEIDFKYDEALATADNIMTFKLAVKTIARKHGLHASFMPKPKVDVCGSGMHLNMTLNNELGKNVFYKADEDGLSDIGMSFMAGVMEHIKGMTAILNPLVNSYKRLVPGYDAPVHIAWSKSSRSPLIRIPRNSKGAATRIELRSPDPSTNPYLALALCLAAGLDGIEKGLKPAEEAIGNLFEMSKEERLTRGIEKLPADIHAAVRFLEQDELLKDTLGKHITNKFIEEKEDEWKRYRTTVSAWELDEYLYKI